MTETRQSENVQILLCLLSGSKGGRERRGKIAVSQRVIQCFPLPYQEIFLKKFLKNFLDFCNLKILRKRHDQVERTDNPVHRQ